MFAAILLWSLLAPGLPSAASQEVECPSGTTEVLGSCFFVSRGDTLNWGEAESVSVKILLLLSYLFSILFYPYF